MANVKKTFKAKTVKTDIYQEVTDRIIEVMEKGKLPWLKPWNDAGKGDAIIQLPYNAVSGKNYSGVNTLLLFIRSMEMNFSSNAWLTFKQAQELGGNIRKGEKGTMITYWSKFSVKEEINGEETEKNIPFVKKYIVFNFEQCENINPEKFQELKPMERPEGFEDLESFVNATGAIIRHGGNRACYLPGKDRDFIMMPRVEQFNETEGYYSTLLHELTHWSGAKWRCDRDLSGRFGSESYAMEELIAEMGSAFVSAQFGINCELQHASYLQSWLKVLKEDKKAIFTAAAKAQEAANYLNGFSQEEIKAA